MNVKIEWYTIGGFQGSKDPQGSCLKKKKMMLEEEGVLFEDDSRIRIECLHTFEE
jgi:alkylated DNA nucleotide flippase Atl1